MKSWLLRAFRKKSGSHLLSHAVSSIVSSAAYVLTFVFGMRTGVSHKRIATRHISLSELCELSEIVVRRSSATSELPWTNAPLFYLSFVCLFDKPTAIQPLLFPLERRWSSRTFRYGYLVTTSPQLPVLPSAAPSLKVGSLTSGITGSHGVTGGVYKTRERIHRDILIRDY